MKFSIIFILSGVGILFSCGNKESDKSHESSTETGKQEEDKEEKSEKDHLPYSIYLESRSDLPECDDDRIHSLAYIAEESAFYGCDANKWTKIEHPENESTEKMIVQNATTKECIAGGKVIVEYSDENFDNTVQSDEVLTRNPVCNGNNTDSIDGFGVKDSYFTAGDGVNLCTQYDPNDNCYLVAAQVDVFNNGNWQVRILMNHFSYVGTDADTTDKDIAFILPDGESTGMVKLVNRFVFRTDGSGSLLWAVIFKEKDEILFVHDTNDNLEMDGTDLIVAEYELSKM